MDYNNEYGIRQIQEKLLEILMYFQQFCNQYNLKFVLAGGTCLGAARDKGIIPWDDDVDVFMLREDYEKLTILWEKYGNKKKYTCQRSNDKMNIHHTATEIRDNDTTFILRHSMSEDVHHGLMIDIIPLDNVASSIFKRKLQLFYSMLFCCFNFQRLPEHKSQFIYFLTKIALSVVKSFKLRYVLWKYAENKFISLGEKNNGMVASFIEGPKIFKQQFPKKWFENPSYLVFEGEEMPVPLDYNKWLKVSYGNYMEPVPMEERIPRHDVIFYDMNTSYKEYKGKYYCININNN